MIDEKIKRLAKGRYGEDLIEILKGVQSVIADVRTPIKSRPEIANEVRIGIIEALDVFLIDKLRIMSGEISPPDLNEHI
jgi:hypothetical protein